MAVGERHYGRIRDTRRRLARPRRDRRPTASTTSRAAFSGGMRQRLQIARNLVTHPRLVFMDEPTGGLDVSVQARLLDLLRGLVADLGLAVVIVTHDLAVARLLSHRMMVMKDGRVIEHGLTDRVLDDPREPYTQLLVSSILAGAETMTEAPHPSLDVRDVAKSFTMHLRGGIRLPRVDDVTFAVAPGECVVLGGPSGAGKSSILKMVYGNYAVDAGAILVDSGERPSSTSRTASPRAVLAAAPRRRSAMSASSCASCRASPALDVVAEPLVARGVPRDEARAARRGRCSPG